MRAAIAFVALLALVPILAGCSSPSPGVQLSTSELQDPVTCKGCHPTQFSQWSGSMHAYASEDPVFLAMNKRGQRETNGALGDFCVKCHAPLAVQQKLTTDGLNLSDADFPKPAKGVTCFFCHSTESVGGTHDNPLTLVADGRLFGPYSNPVPGSPHKVSHSDLLDDLKPASAAACGSCHDIVNGHGAAIERTYQEWQGTLFAVPPNGQTCAHCHMSQQPNTLAATTTTKKRTTHDHGLPGIDLALTPFPNAEEQKQGVQTLIDPTLLTSVCWSPRTSTIEVDLDNAAAGHGFPSGASQDRRVWVEVTAYAAGAVIYQSGVAAAGQTVESAPDPDLWMIRDCMFGADGKLVNMFWQAATFSTNELPGSVMPTVTDPTSFTKTHIKTLYPGGGAALSAAPDRISVKVHIKALADEVLQDLVASGDLDPSFLSAVATLTPLSGTLDWTMPPAPVTGSEPPIYCVYPGRLTFAESPNVAKSNARCAP